MSRTNDFSLDSLAADWEKVKELIENGHYEQAAKFLQSALISLEQYGVETLTGLFVALQICLACGQARTEMVWHLRAQEEACEREGRLRDQLWALLERLSGGDSDNPHSNPPDSKSDANPITPNEFLESHKLWGIIQRLLGDRKNARAPSVQTTSDQRAGAQTSSSEGPGHAPNTSGDPAASSITAPGDQAQPSLAVYCLGPFRLFGNGRMIGDWLGLRGKSIFKYLFRRRHTPVSKEVLMEVFWPDADIENARRNLHQAIYGLRRTLKQVQPDFQFILSEKDCYQINPDLNLWLDFEEFEQRFKAARRLESAGKIAEAMAEYSSAEELYRGDFLEEDLYEEWAGQQREQLRADYLELVDWLSAQLARQGDHAAAIALCRKILEKDNCHEIAHRRLMFCYQAMGQTSMAARQYQICVRALETELDSSPSSETQTLFKNLTSSPSKLSL